MTDEESICSWVAENRILSDAIMCLFKEDFTSMEALKLLDSKDLKRKKKENLAKADFGFSSRPFESQQHSRTHCICAGPD